MLTFKEWNEDMKSVQSLSSYGVEPHKPGMSSKRACGSQRSGMPKKGQVGRALSNAASRSLGKTLLVKGWGGVEALCSLLTKQR